VKVPINKSLADCLAVLHSFDPSSPRLTVAEISEHLKYSQSRTYRLVRTLIQLDFLMESPERGRYSLGLNALRIGLVAQQSISLPMIAKPLMEELCQITRETVILVAVHGTKGFCLERVESEEPVRASAFKPGSIFPLHCGASSKALMAHLSEQDWDRIIMKEGLQKYTANTITNVTQLKANLREIRRLGYAYSDQEIDRDVRAVGAPIFNGVGQLVAALSAGGPTFRMNANKVKEMAKLVVQYAQSISSLLGHEIRKDDTTGIKTKTFANLKMKK
jgi:IclR family KDG regulon transcriptional repressor